MANQDAPHQRSKLKALGAVLMLGWAASASAQFGGSMGGSMGRRQRSSEGSPEGGKRKDDTLPAMARTNQALERLADLRFQLMITAEQTAIWNAFEGKAQNWIAEVFKRRDAVPGSPGLQFLQMRLTDSSNRYTLMENLVEAAKKLYEVLTPEQQRIADHYLPGAVPA